MDFSIDANPYVLFLILILLILSTENQAKAELIKRQTKRIVSHGPRLMAGKRPQGYGNQLTTL